MRAQFILTLFVASLVAQGQPSPLHTLDQIIAESTSRSPDSEAENTITFILDHALSTTLHNLDTSTIESTFVHKQSSFLSGNQPGIPEIAIVRACNEWSATLSISASGENNAA